MRDDQPPTALGIFPITYNGNVERDNLQSSPGQGFSALYSDISDVILKMNTIILGAPNTDGQFYVRYENLFPPTTTGYLKYDGTDRLIDCGTGGGGGRQEEVVVCSTLTPTIENDYVNSKIFHIEGEITITFKHIPTGATDYIIKVLSRAYHSIHARLKTSDVSWQVGATQLTRFDPNWGPYEYTYTKTDLIDAFPGNVTQDETYYSGQPKYGVAGNASQGGTINIISGDIIHYTGDQHPPTGVPRVRGSFTLDGRVVYTPPFA